MNSPTTPRLTLHTRDYFYVGGLEHTSNDGEIVYGQVYVEHLTPTQVTRNTPIVFVHGNGLTGTTWLSTPDGRPGWADYFLARGYEVEAPPDLQRKRPFIFYQVYIIDQPCRGRSPWHQGINGSQSTLRIQQIESRMTATAKYNLWPEAALHTQWPGTGTKGDPIFDAFYRSIVPSFVSHVEVAELMKVAGSELLDKIGVGHSKFLSI